MATEEPEIFLGTLMEYSSLQLGELEARLDAEEMERIQMRESLSSLEFHNTLPPTFKLEEKCEEIVAIGRASVTERETSAEARAQQHDRQTKNQPRGIIRSIRLLAEIIVLLIVGISVLSGEFAPSQPFDLFSQQGTQQNTPSIDVVVPSQLYCPVFEVLDVNDANPCTSDQIGEHEDTPSENDERQDDAQITDQWQTDPQNDVSTFQIILSTATGQVHHFAFAFVNLPLVPGCALRRLRV